MSKAKAPLWGELLYHIGDLYRDTGSVEDVVQKLKDRGFDGSFNMQDCDDHPLAKYLRTKIDAVIYVGLNFVTMEYGDGGVLSISLPHNQDWQRWEKQKDSPVRQRNRLADALWQGLDELRIVYDKDANDIHGCPVVAIRSRKIVIFTRRCHAYAHSCIGGDELQHTGIVRELRNKGWTVYTLWECQLRGGSAHLEVLLSALKGPTLE